MVVRYGYIKVTEENEGDIPAKEGETKTGKASYNAETKTLMLNNYNYEGAGYNEGAIYAEEDLTIELTDDNTVTATSDDS